jgi:hypothetical protein
MLANTLAHAKLVFNKKLQSYKLVVAFNTHKRIVKRGNTEVVKYSFPVQSKCAYVSGDLLAENLQAELATVMPNVVKSIRSTNIQFVE